MHGFNITHSYFRFNANTHYYWRKGTRECEASDLECFVYLCSNLVSWKIVRVSLMPSYSFIFSSVNSKSPCDTVFLDIRKALDTVPHQELLFKLWSHGITGLLWNWFRAYLSKRSHFVHIDGYSSTSLPVKSAWCPAGKCPGTFTFSDIYM